MIKILLILSLIFFGKVLSDSRPHTLRYHTANDFDINGNTCASHRPDVKIECPIFGIYSKNVYQDDFEEKCREYGFSCNEGEHLFIDGGCRSCPNDQIIVQRENDVFCENPNNPNIFSYKNLINPFECISEDDPLIVTRQEKGLYRPCYNMDSGITIIASQFVTSDDVSSILSLTECAKSLNKDIEKQCSEINRKFTLVPFSTIGSSDTATYAKAGYLQCTKREPEKKNYLSSGWIVFYSIYIIGTVYCILFSLFKYILESNIKNNEKFFSDNSTQSIEETQKDEHYISQISITQQGYTKSFLGTLALFIFIILSLGLVLLLLVITLDMFGLTYFWFCKNQPDIVAKCEKSIAEGTDPDWRMGYNCANGCLFDQATTRGNDPEWPYYPIEGGGARSLISFMIVWHITLVWYALLKMFSKKIIPFFYLKSPISKATFVLISKQIEKEIITQSNAKSTIRRFSNYVADIISKIIGRPCHYKLCKINFEKGIYYFDFQCLRYCWNESTCKYQVSTFKIEKSQKELFSIHFDGLSETTAFNRFKLWGSNSIEIEIPSLFMSILEEISGYLYLYQLLALLNWLYTNYWIPPLISFLIIVISAGIKITTKRKSQWKIKKMVHKTVQIDVYRDSKWHTIDSSLLVPGDLVKISNSHVLTCDCLLIDGRTVMDESSLTGEPTPVPKISINPTSDQIFDRSQANLKYTLFAGSYIESHSVGKSGSTLAVVFATGATTYKGQLIRDLLFPPPISFTFDQHITVVYMVLLAWGSFTLLNYLYLLDWVLQSWILGTFVMSQIINPLIPAVYVAALSQGAIHLSKLNVYCVNFQRMAIAGKIKTFCFDKTGTLTQSGLEFKGIYYCSSDNKQLENLENASQFPQIIKNFCGSCNELDFIPSSKDNKVEIVGNEVDVALFSSSGFEAYSEGSDVYIKYNKNVLKVLRRFEFDRATMTMSVVVEDENGKKFVFTKGSYEVVSRLVYASSLPSDYFKKADASAKKGIYTLGMAYKDYIEDNEENSIDLFKVSRKIIESNLTCLGLIMFENPLKSDTFQVVKQVREGNIQTRILTGDNSLTASYIARTSGIVNSKRIILGDCKNDDIFWRDFDSNESLSDPLKMKDSLQSGEIDLAITGNLFSKLSSIRNADQLDKLNKLNKTIKDLDSLEDDSLLTKLIPYIKIYSRLTPDQKVLVVGEQMKYNLTGMCGDGANDVGALRLAHCGIAISAGTSEAGIVSHFSSPNSSLEVVLDVLKEGRSTLSKTMAGFKTLIVFGQTKAMMGMIQPYYAIIVAEFFWIVWDAFLYVGMAWCLLQSMPAKKLADTRPTAKMFGLETLFSTIGVILINYAFIVGSIGYLYTFDWFLCHEFDPNSIDHLKWWLKGDNYEAMILSLMATFTFLGAAPAFNFGYKYRSEWYKNYYLIIFFCICFAFFSYLFLGGTTFISCLARVNCGDQSVINHMIKNGRLSISSPPSNAPVGCPCESQFANGGEYCEEEYINCKEDAYNSNFHHNIIWTNDIWKFWLLGVVNIIAVILWESVVILGPVRKFLRRRSIAKQLENQKLK